ncbi:hypothetical protein F5B21DRAFT_502770 [Xylaria acuta]|nr:hypothetical protein F5B21DRAFT_502770 [Xylaria acuta]
MNDTTETLADIEWPFSQQPLNLGTLDDHPILLTVADHTDLDAISRFTAWSYIAIEQARRSVPPVYFWDQWPLIVERFKSSLQAIMESCIPNEMKGIILKIEHRDVIKGIMALNIAQTDHGDPWTRHQLLQLNSLQYPRVFPTAGYLELLSQTMNNACNGLRPILNVPHLIPSLDEPYRMTCLTAFTTMLVRIARECQHTLFINIHEGGFHALFGTDMTYNTGFLECGQIIGEALPIRQYSPGYRAYVGYVQPSYGRQQLCLDRAVREAFDNFGFPLLPPQGPSDDLSPVPSLEDDSGNSSPESI